MKYPLHLIESFMAFETYKGVTNAAKVLKISQPALSRQLVQLESLVGAKLFQKSGRTKNLSPIGRELFLQLSQTWQNYDQLIDNSLSYFLLQPNSPLQMYGPAEVISKICATARFRYSMIFTPVRSSVVAEYVMRDQCSIGVTRFVPDSADLTSKKLFTENFYFLVPSQWGLTSKNLSQTFIHQIEKLPCVAYAEDFDYTPQFYEKYKIKCKPNIQRIIPNWSVLQSLVEAGVGWAMAPANLIKKSSHVQMILIPDELYPSVTYYILYKKNSSKISWFNETLKAVSAIY